MRDTLIANAHVVNRGKTFVGHVLISDQKIKDVFTGELSEGLMNNCEVVEAQGLWLIPGAIDDQVHFREPGLTHKAEIATESKAAVAGGITSFMEMPNTNPQTVTQEALQAKFARAAEVSPANYSFFIGATNNNLDQVLATDIQNVCGIKIFMGSSTGNMLVDNTETLDKIFKDAKMLIATHCEDEAIIRANSAKYRNEYGDNVPFRLHPVIRSTEACYKSSFQATELAKKHNTRLHILHISTAKETSLFRNDVPLEDKRITAEACIHHLWFTDRDYDQKGSRIKWNPAVKTQSDQDEIWAALLDGRIDVLATDHAPHTIEEKNGNYWTAPSGGPLVQHFVPAIMDCVANGKISMERAVEKMSHSPAVCFNIKDRGFIEPGMFADLVLVDRNVGFFVDQKSLLYKCGWSPFEGHTFSSSIVSTYVNGNRVYHQGEVDATVKGQALSFSR